MPVTALAGDAEGAAEERLRRHRTERHHDPWLQPRKLGRQPHPAGCLLRSVGALVQPSLATQLVLEVLYGIGQVERGAIEASLIERPIEQVPCGPNERQSLHILLEARLLADQHYAGIVRTGAEHRLRRALP